MIFHGLPCNIRSKLSFLDDGKIGTNERSAIERCDRGIDRQGVDKHRHAPGRPPARDGKTDSGAMQLMHGIAGVLAGRHQGAVGIGKRSSLPRIVFGHGPKRRPRFEEFQKLGDAAIELRVLALTEFVRRDIDVDVGIGTVIFDLPAHISEPVRELGLRGCPPIG